MSKIKILHCISSVDADAGTEKQLEEWIRRIDRDRFEIHLCCFEGGERFLRLARYAHTLILPVRRAYTPWGLLQIWRLRRYINAHGIHIVQTYFIKSNIVGTLAARRSKCRAIVSCRLDLGYWFNARLHRVFCHLDKHATRLLANAEAVKRAVMRNEQVRADKIDIIYNRVDTSAYAPGTGDPAVAEDLGVPADAKVVGIIANLRPVKDHDLFLRAAAIVAGEVPDTAFLLLGQGRCREALEPLANELGIADKVFFAGRVGYVQDYLERMDIGCLSSKSEGFPNTIVEYMAAGLPVVATDVGGMREAVEHGVTGYVVPHGRPEDFATPIIDLLTNDGKREEMGRAALERCREKWDLDITIREFEEYYADLARGGGR